MTEKTVEISCLERRRIDGKRIYNYRQWLERFKQYTKRKCGIDTEALFIETTITETDWNTKEEEKNSNIFFGHSDLKQHIQLHYLNTETNRTKSKSTNKSSYRKD